MAQPVAERAVEVRPFVQRVHLVDAHPDEASAAASMASSTVTGSPLASGTTTLAPGARWSRTASGLTG